MYAYTKMPQPPAPSNPEEASRWEHTRHRRAMMEGRWTLTFDQDNFTWQAIQYEDEDDPHGILECEGTWDRQGYFARFR